MGRSQDRRIPRAAGIYSWYNRITGEHYVGSTTDLRKRHYEHLSHLDAGTHTQRFQPAWDAYGEENFDFQIREIVDLPVDTYAAREILKNLEQTYLDAEEPIYNSCPNAYTPLGYRHTEESLAVMRAAQRDPEMIARLHTDEINQRIAEAQTGKELSVETRHRISQSRRAMFQDPSGVAYRVLRDSAAKRANTEEGRRAMQARAQRQMESPSMRQHLRMKALQQWHPDWFYEDGSVREDAPIDSDGNKK